MRFISYACLEGKNPDSSHKKLRAFSLFEVFDVHAIYRRPVGLLSYAEGCAVELCAASETRKLFMEDDGLEVRSYGKACIFSRP